MESKYCMCYLPCWQFVKRVCYHQTREVNVNILSRLILKTAICCETFIVEWNITELEYICLLETNCSSCSLAAIAIYTCTHLYLFKVRISSLPFEYYGSGMKSLKISEGRVYKQIIYLIEGTDYDVTRS